MCSAIGVNLQRGMNFRLRGTDSIILMSLRSGAPYADRVEDEGKILIYEGHDCARTIDGPDPKRTDQPEYHPGGSLTQNGLFARAARRYKETGGPAERVRVYGLYQAGSSSKSGNGIRAGAGFVERHQVFISITSFRFRRVARRRIWRKATTSNRRFISSVIVHIYRGFVTPKWLTSEPRHEYP
jgi:hypothetical protein